MKIKFEQLIFEITRRCNLSCAHCLRGDAQDVDMIRETVDSLLSQVESIGHVTFSGGEPSLGEDVLEYIVDQIIERGIPVDGFYVATNGVIVSEKLALALLRLYSYLEDHDDFSSLDVSIDEFHENEDFDFSDFGIYRGLSFFNIRNNNYSRPNYIINRGRAFENGIGNRDDGESDPSVAIINDICVISDANIYINANGDVINGCDFSYDDQDDLKICNVFDNIAQKMIDYSIARKDGEKGRRYA